MAVKDIQLILAEAAKVLQDLSPEIQLAPEYDLTELMTQRCVIVPTNRTITRLSRKSGVLDVKYSFDVGLMLRARDLDTDTLLNKIQEVTERLYNARLLGTRCTKAEPSPLYDADQIRESNQFITVISLTYQELTS